MILTLDVPDDLAEQIRTAAAAEGQDLNHYAVARLKMSFNLEEGEYEETGPEPDLLDALRQGIADDDAGRVLTLEELDARINATLASKTVKAL